MKCGNAAPPQQWRPTLPQCCDVTCDHRKREPITGEAAKPHLTLLSLKRGTRQGKNETKSTTDKIASGGRSGGP